MDRRSFLKVVGITTTGTTIPLVGMNLGQALTNESPELIIGKSTLVKISTLTNPMIFEVPSRAIATDTGIKVNAIKGLKLINENESFTITKLEARVPKVLRDAFKAMGIHRDWMALPIEETFVPQNFEVTINFSEKGIIAIE